MSLRIVKSGPNDIKLSDRDERGNFWGLEKNFTWKPLNWGLRGRILVATVPGTVRVTTRVGDDGTTEPRGDDICVGQCE